MADRVPAHGRPIFAEGGKRSVYFPDEMVDLEGGKAYKQGEVIEVAAALDEIPAYVRKGTILPLGPVIQNTGQQPGGPLEVRVYPGKNASFTLVEDDGESNDYLKGMVRKTTFQWDDAARTLGWKRTGAYSGKNVFRQVKAVVFGADGRRESMAELGEEGEISLK